jgi:hypothetical protein
MRVGEIVQVCDALSAVQHTFAAIGGVLYRTEPDAVASTIVGDGIAGD